MKFLPKGVAVLAISFILGVGSAGLGVKWSVDRASLKNGPWYTNLAIGSQGAGMYTRAVIAIAGLFALNKSEAIYYNAKSDDQGKVFSTACDYRMEGKDMNARWWSFTIYGDDHFLVPNKENRYSYNLKNLAREPDRSYKVYLSSQRKAGNWLPIGDTGSFTITLRLYNPDKGVYEDPAHIELPSIIKEGCR